ncbi:MAG: hypothetical protein HYV36_06995, partial [Lentisphaerae bacterium]|nr:hypothetical protein [Lentisphaerota bacterium]
QLQHRRLEQFQGLPQLGRQQLNLALFLFLGKGQRLIYHGTFFFRLTRNEYNNSREALKRKKGPGVMSQNV